MRLQGRHLAIARFALDLPMPSVQRAGGEFGQKALSLFKPATLKARTPQSRHAIGTLTHETPEQAGAVVLDHQDDQALVQAVVKGDTHECDRSPHRAKVALKVFLNP